MISFKTYTRKNKALLLFPSAIGVLISCALIVVFRLLDDNLLYLYIAGGVMVLSLLLQLIFFFTFKKYNKDTEIVNNLKSISGQIEKLKADDFDIKMNKTEIKEIQDLKDSLTSSIDVLKNRRYLIEDYKDDIEVKEQEAGILTKECFEKKIERICKKKYLTNLTIVAANIDGETSIDIRAKLKDLIHKTFANTLIGYYDEHTLLFAIEQRGNISIVLDRLETIVSLFNVANFGDNDVSLSTCNLGVAFYPFSNRANVINHAIQSLNKDKPVTTYDYEHKYIDSGDTTSINDNYLRTLYNINHISTMTIDIKTEQDIKEKIVYVINKYASLFEFANAGFLVKIPGRPSFKPLYEYKKTKSDTGFANYDEMSFDKLKDYLSLFDASGVFFGSDIDGLPLACRSLFNNLNIRSFYHFKITYLGELVGIVYFNDFEKQREFDIINLEIMMNLRHSLTSLANILFAWRGVENEQELVDSLLKRDEKYVYSINDETYELISVSANMLKVYPELEIGHKCYEYFNEEKEPCKDCPLKVGHCAVSRSRIGRDLNAAVLYSRNDIIKEKYIVIENSIKSNKHIEDQLDLDFRILNNKALNEDIGKELRREASGYVATIAITDINEHAKDIPGEGKIKILGEIINRLKSIGYSDWLYRYNEDTLALLFFRYPRSEAISAIEKIYKRISGDLLVEGQELNLNYAVSLISYPGDIVSTKDVKATLDLAIKQTKGMGSNILYIYGEKGGRKLDRSLYILDVLDEAIKKNKLQFFVQPVIDASNKKPVEGEILLRLSDPTRGLIPPLEFVPIASKNGRMFEIEQSIILAIGELYKKHGFGIFKQVGVKRISVNISQDSLSNETFAERVENTIKKYKLPKNFLQLEIAESLAYKNAVHVKEIMDKLKPLGICFAIDNFGTVPISEYEQINLPFDIIKIDRSIILDIEQNQRSLVSLSYMIDKAKELGCEVVAQGVENENQLELIKSMPIDAYQGYFFSKPLAMNNYIEFLNFKN